MATLQQLEQALRAADAAGNTDDARRLAQAYAAARSAQAPSFANVESSATPTVSEAPARGPDPTEGMSGFDRFAAGAGKSIVDTGRGLAQLGVDFVNAPATMTRAIRGEESVPQGRLDRATAGLQASQAEADRLDAPLMDTGSGLAGNVAGYGAQLLTPAAALRGTAGARALLPTTIAGNAAQGAALGAAQPLAEGDSRLENATWGGAFGAGGATLAKGVGALGTKAKTAIAPHVREVYEAAKARGINLSPAQISDSRFMKFAQSMLRSVPFTGAQGRYEAQVGAFNRELAKTIGEDAPIITSQVYDMAKRRQSDKFTELTARNAMKVDDRLLRSLTNIAESSKVSPAIAQEVEAAIDSLYSRATTGPGGVVIPGEAYQAFDSELGQIIKNGGPTSHFLGNVQSAVRRAMDDSISPEDAAAWKQLRREYGNRKTLTPLVAKANDGPISPAQVQGAVTANRSGKEAMASGQRGALGELARIGQRLKEPPSSGTAERSVVGAMLGGGAVVDPVTGGLTAIGLNMLSRGLDSEALAKVIMRQNPGMTRQAAAAIIRRSANPAGQNYLAGDGAPVVVPMRANALAQP